jgi:hypothetical protein
MLKLGVQINRIPVTEITEKHITTGHQNVRKENTTPNAINR